MTNLLMLPSFIEERYLKKFKWKNYRFKYIDNAYHPLLDTYRPTSDLRNIIVDNFPAQHVSDKEFVPQHSKLYLPFASDLDQAWYLGTDNIAANFDYEPLSAMFYVIRDHPNEFFDIVNGRIISTEEHYTNLRRSFNMLYEKALNEQGSGTRGQLSLDEMIGLGSTFYLLMLTADLSQGLQTEDSLFRCGWSNIVRKVHLDKRIFSYSTKLKHVNFSSLDWTQFFFKYGRSTDRDSFWLYTPPKLERKQETLTVQDLINISEQHISLFSSKGTAVMLVVDIMDEEIAAYFENQIFGRSKVSEYERLSESKFVVKNF